MKRQIIQLYTIFAIAVLSFSQDVSNSTVADCIAKPGYFFCSTADDLSTKVDVENPDSAYGYCCHASTVDARCTDSGSPLQGIQCSKTVPDTELTAADIGMFMTYEIGMRNERASACASSSSST